MSDYRSLANNTVAGNTNPVPRKIIINTTKAPPALGAYSQAVQVSIGLQD